MNKLRVFEAFAGVGSQRMALRNLNIDHEVVGICEIDKYALKSYEAIHGDCENFGDISKVETKDLPDMDLFTYSFPCQDLSVAGKQAGLGEGTRSGLLYECEKIIENKKPKYLLLENVKNLVGKKFKSEFDKWLGYLEGLGYTNYWKVLNAKDYGVPQNRERVFVVSILNDSKGFEFKEKIKLNKRIKDILENEVDEKYYINKEFKVLNTQFEDKNKPNLIGGVGEINFGKQFRQGNRIYDSESIAMCLTAQPVGNAGGNSYLYAFKNYSNKEKILVKQATKKGYIEMEVGGVCDLTYPNSKTRRGRVQEGGSICPTLTAASQDIVNIDEQYRVRKLTPLECWRLMGFSDDDFYKAKNAGISNSQLYKQAGNSIVVDVLEGIFENLFKEYTNEKNN